MTAYSLARKPTAVLLAFACGITVASGVAATAATKSKTVKACVTSKHFLATASKNKCPKGTHPLTLGVKGAPGAAGAKGNPGTNGLSEAIVGSDLGSASLAVPSAGFVAVAQIASAPAGTYVANFDVQAHNEGGGPAALFCEFGTSATGDLLGLDGETSIDTGLIGTLSDTTTFTLPAASSVVARCDDNAGQTLYALHGYLTLTRVNTVTAPAP